MAREHHHKRSLTVRLGGIVVTFITLVVLCTALTTWGYMSIAVITFAVLGLAEFYQIYSTCRFVDPGSFPPRKRE